MATLKELRAEVLRAHKLTGSKISRTKRVYGTEISGTSLDPRRDLKKVKRYTRKQLETYKRELDSFRARDRQYIASASGEFVSPAAVRMYRRREREFNAKHAEIMASIENIRLPGSDMTIGERESDFGMLNRRARGMAVARPYFRVERDVSAITDERALKALQADLERRMSPGYEFQTRARQRMEMSEMFAQLGITSDSAQSHLYTQFQGLSDRQFDILWNYTEFATHVSARYEAIKVANARDAAMIEESFADDIQEALDWAKSL